MAVAEAAKNVRVLGHSERRLIMSWGSGWKHQTCQNREKKRIRHPSLLISG